MKAAFLTAHGGPEKFRYGDMPDPVAGPGEVVVDIHAASVNAADYKVRLGSYDFQTEIPLHPRSRLFRDRRARGPGVSDLAVGDAVFGVCDAGIEGAYAEKIAIKAAIIAKKPDRLSHAEAAAMALTSLTAIWALEDTAQLKSGETILIQGGAGGVAGFAIQLAKHLGASVDHDGERAQSRLCPRSRRRPRDRLQQGGFHQGRWSAATWCSTRSAARCRSNPMTC